MFAPLGAVSTLELYLHAPPPSEVTTNPSPLIASVLEATLPLSVSMALWIVSKQIPDSMSFYPEIARNVFLTHKGFFLL